MAKHKEARGFTWPWIITAWLFPFLVLGLLGVGYLSKLRGEQEERANAVARPVAGREAEYSALMDAVRDVMTRSGYVVAKSEPQTIPPRELPPEEATGELTPIQLKYKPFQSKTLNEATNSVSKMRADIAQLRVWRQGLEQELAYKLYDQYYSIEHVYNTGDKATGERALRAFGELRRQARQESNNLLRPTADALLRAHERFLSGETPSDPALSLAQRPTLELVALLQFDLLAALADALLKQEALLYGEAEGWDNLKYREDSFVKQTGEQRRKLQTLGTENTGVVDETRRAYEEEHRRYSETLRYDITNLRDTVAAELQRMGEQYDNEVRAHIRDGRTFAELLQKNKRIAQQYPLTSREEIDGRVAFVNREAKLCHIDLGTDLNVHSGQRFEVWSVGGRKEDERFKGVIEVVRPLSGNFSLCVILDMVAESQPIGQGDALINVLWAKGKYVKVALHGRYWGGDYTRYGKYRLEEILRGLGCTVHEQLQPGTNLVILGDSPHLDQYYRENRGKIRVDSVEEKRIRLYVDPR